MISLAETGLMNALLAVALALPVLALGRCWQRPALIHAFWILVLIKLIAPPLYLVPIRMDMLVEQHIESPANNVAPTASHCQGALVGISKEVIPQTVPGLRPHPDSQLARSALPTEPLDRFSFLAACIGSRRDHAALGLNLLQRLIVPWLIFWFVGSMCWFAWQGWRIVSFTQVFLKYARRGPISLQHLAQRLAQPMGISNTPEIWLLPAVVSPMLWSVGGKARILFPTDLLARLDEGAVATLLTHELAHYRRGDHHVRLLEFLVSGLFWWHPVIWLARRELEIAEEKCCDAWVVSQFPAAPRKYADALLATLDFLAEDHPPMPAVACGLGEVPLLRQRLKLIMRGTAPKSLSLLGRAAVVATAMLIPISPSLQFSEAAIPAVAQSGTSTTVEMNSGAPVSETANGHQEYGARFAKFTQLPGRDNNLSVICAADPRSKTEPAPVRSQLLLRLRRRHHWMSKVRRSTTSEVSFQTWLQAIKSPMLYQSLNESRQIQWMRYRASSAECGSVRRSSSLSANSTEKSC